MFLDVSDDKSGLMMKKEEKRRFPRIGMKKPVHFQFLDPSQYGDSLSGDISEGGLRLRVNEFIALGEILQLEFQLKSMQMIVLTAKVVWVNKLRFTDQYEIGVEFIEGNEDVVRQKQIEEFVGAV